MNIFQLLDEQFKKKVNERFKGKIKADENKLRKCILDAFRETMYDIMMKHPELANNQKEYYPIYPWFREYIDRFPKWEWSYITTTSNNCKGIVYVEVKPTEWEQFDEKWVYYSIPKKQDSKVGPK